MFNNRLKNNKLFLYGSFFNRELFDKYNKIIKSNTQEIKIGNYGRVNFINNLVIKYFKDSNYYFNEKEIYRTKLPQYCGCIIKENETFIYEYDDLKTVIYPIYENNKMIITDDYLIKNIIKLSSKQVNKIIICDSYILTDNNTNLGFIIENNNTFNIYIDSFKILKLLHFNDNYKSLYYENLGINLSDSYKNTYPSYEQRIFLSIDLIRQIKELIDRSIYHNDIKNDNIVIKSINKNYYINLIDYGLAVTLNDLLEFEYLTSPNSFSPEYYIINTLLHNKKINITSLINDLLKVFPDIYKKNNNSDIDVKNIKELLDNSLHCIIGGIIINILSWKDIQFPVWTKHYNSNNYNIGYDISFLKHLNNYTSHDIALDYLKEMLTELFKNKFLYSIIDSINIYPDYKSIKNIIDDRFKNEYLDLLLVIYNLFEFSPDKKMSLSVMYDKLKNYPGYQKYLDSKPNFL
jgi:hypothetical protein